MKKTLPISRETIEVLEQMTKVNPSLWIVPGRMQIAQSYDGLQSLIVHLKDAIPGSWFPFWEEEKVYGFGIYDGITLLKVIKDMKNPILDFSGLKTKKSHLVLAAQDHSTAKFNTCAPNILRIMDINKLKSPPFEVRIDLPWSILQKINKVLRFAREGSLKIRSDGKVCWLKSENSEGGNEIEMNFDNKWLPKKPFQYMLQNKYFEVPKGDYILHLSEHGMSKWVSADGKYIYYIELEPKENWFIKKQTKGPLTAKSEILPIKVLTGKEYKIASGYAEKVNKSWRKSIDAIIETGELLDQAMKKFKKDEMMWSTFMNSLPFGLRAVEMLINIAKNKSLLLHPEIYKALPASWGTLYALVNIGPSQPIIIYQNNHGEISQAPKSGFDKTTVTKEDFLLRGIEGKDALIRPEMTKADAIKYKAEIDSLYFPKLSNETFLTIELEAGKTVTTSALKKIKAAVQGLIKGKPLLLIENANVIKK